MNPMQAETQVIERENIDFIKTNLRFKRTHTYYLHFFIYLFPSFFIFLGLTIFYYGRLKVNPGEHSGNFLPMAIITFGIAFLLFTHKKIKETESFEIIPITKFDLPTIEKEISNTFKIREIKFHEDLNVLHVQTKVSFFSLGENLKIGRAHV